ncbi:MAG: hypothetical protein Pyrs2KO_32880 [Pyruvatibacter sp.]
MALGAVVAAHDENAGRVLVQPMDELDAGILVFRAGHEAILKAGPVTGHAENTGLLVEDQEIVVHMQHIQIGLHGRRIVEGAEGRFGVDA